MPRSALPYIVTATIFFIMANTIKLTVPFSKKPSAEKWSQMRDKKELMFAHMDSMLTQAKTGFPCGPYPYYKMGYGWVQVYFNEQEGQHLKAHTVRAMTKTCGHLQDVLCLTLHLDCNYVVLKMLWY